jgi:N-acyl-D-amino-acid deacylase
VRKKHLITLQDAIRKMTSLPALKFQIEGRGILQPGMFADIVIFDTNTV